MRLPKFLRPLRRLRWKLTFSYTAVTIAVLLTLEVVTALVLVLTSSSALDSYEELVATLAAQARPFLEATPLDTLLMEAWLREAVPSGEPAVIIGPSGEFLAANNQEVTDEVLSGQPFLDRIVPDESRRLIDQSLDGKPEILRLDDGTILAVAPILSEGDTVLGVLYLRGFSDILIPGYNSHSALEALARSLIALTVVLVLIGTLFGRMTSRGLVRRLEDLASTTQAWGQGDFTASVHDASPDEIGQLTRRMSLMAEQIQELLQARQDLATLEERNRLARDLHDSVKQQVFAATMTLATAETLWEQDPQTARQKMAEALELSRQAQKELAGLIHELRPGPLEGKGLATALREYGQRWSRQSGIEAGVALHGEHPIPPEVEQALFRLAQEALANVSRHSGAERVQITLTCTESAITLEVADDGRGFDPATETGTGIGLRSMRERIEALGGELTVESVPGQGTRLVARCGPAPGGGG
jgi:NarL family two-component system sensor histidine kinase LiaS